MTANAIRDCRVWMAIGSIWIGASLDAGIWIACWLFCLSIYFHSLAMGQVPLWVRESCHMVTLLVWFEGVVCSRAKNGSDNSIVFEYILASWKFIEFN